MAIDNTFLEDLQDLCQDDAEDNESKKVDTTSCENEDSNIPTKLFKARTLLFEVLANSNNELNSNSMTQGKLANEFVTNCNTLLDYIETETLNIHAFVCNMYQAQFPELENLVPHPLDYARVVTQIGNETKLTLVDFQGILPSATIMVVLIADSTTRGKPLLELSLKRVMEACDCILALDMIKNKVLEIMQQKMITIAPNLTTIVGCRIAAKLIGYAGGISELVKMPGCNLQVLGAKRIANLEGYSTATTIRHFGVIYESEIVQRTPPLLRKKACCLVAGKASLAVRVDYQQGNDKEEEFLLNEITTKIANWQKLPPAPISKALPITYCRPTKRRGGLRQRKRKEKYMCMYKSVKRVPFGIVQSNSLTRIS